jgi:alpha-D-xyloside xylohydrolase
LNEGFVLNKVICVCTAFAFLSVGACGRHSEPVAQSSHYAKTQADVVVTPAGGPAKKVRLTVLTPKVIRVTAFPGESVLLPPSLMAVGTAAGNVPFDVSERDGVVSVKTVEVLAEVSLDTGRVSFRDKQGRVVLSELAAGRHFTPVDVQGDPVYSIRQQFESPADEAFYGLGQHQNGQMNYKGENVELAQHNTDVAVPFVVSSRNYGLLWDNNSITRFGDPRPWQPLAQSLDLYDADGNKGGLTAHYYDASGKTLLTRVESELDYQYGPTSPDNYPRELAKVPHQRVVWEGKIAAQSSGRHTFALYASDYHKLYIDGRVVLDAWRQNWNPWYRNFALDLKKGEQHSIRIEWNRTSGYLTVKHRDALPVEEQSGLSLSSESGRAIDYYFIAGGNADEVIGGYRFVTGKSVLLPRWAYGFWQSRERYETQAELLGVVAEYRKRGIPIDNIVQDWFYWREDGWGSHQFDPARYPDPQALVDQLHAQHAQLMISVWPKFYPTTEHFKQLDAKGFIYHRNLEQQQKDWVGPGYVSSFYDPYSADARHLFWQQVEDNLGKLGIDAWWLDASEPDIQSNLDPEERKLRMGPTAVGPGGEVFNSYPLLHARGVYEGFRGAHPSERAFILTRSAFPGLQRYAAATWSGDVASRWSDLHDQISAGVNFSLSGLPNWSFDIGGFALEPRYEKPNAKDRQEWLELNTRWFEFGAFVPLFRSHGQMPYREIYNLGASSPDTYRTLVFYDKLRYRLLPYIYTVAAQTYHNDYTIMRGLIMDFANDGNVRNIADEYMFGPALLVSPVYEYGARSRDVYLPAGTSWYDFYTSAKLDGGTHVNAAAPLAHIPLYVRAGSIIPVGPEIQYTGEKPDAAVTLYVYTGRDGAFNLYEDAGTDYGYEKGAFATIPLTYDDSRGELTLGARKGEFPGMVGKRRFNVRWICAGVKDPLNFDADADATVEYSGGQVVVHKSGHTD